MSKNGNVTKLTKKGIIVNLKDAAALLIDIALTKVQNELYLEALPLLYRAITLEPRNKEAYVILIETLIEMTCYDQALWQLSMAIDVFGEYDANILMLLGNCYIGMEQYAAALDAYSILHLNAEEDASFNEDVLESVLDAMDYCEYMMDVYSEDEYESLDFNEAEMQPIRDVADIEREELIKTIESLYKDEEYSKVIDLVEPYMRQNPNDSILGSILLMAYYCSREFERGAKYIKSLKRGALDSAQMHCLASLIYSKAGMEAESESECNAALRLEPDSADTALKVYAMLCELGNRKEQAFKYARLCYKMSPYDKEIIHAYARCLAICGNTDYAAKLYERILKIDPGDIVAKYYKKICIEETDLDENVIPVAYIFPPGELMARMMHSLIHLESHRKLDSAACEEAQQLARWAVRMENSKLAASFLAFVRPFHAQMHNLCQYIIKHPDVSYNTKMIAINGIRPEAPPKGNLVFKRGRLMYALMEVKSVSDKNKKQCEAKERIPADYHTISDIVKSHLRGKRGAPWKKDALLLLDEFTKEGSKERSRFTDAQMQSIGAAIIYVAPFVTNENHPKYTHEQHLKFLETYKLTETRFRNALRLLIKYSKTAAKTIDFYEK